MVSDFDKSLVEKYIPVNKQKKALKKLEKNYPIQYLIGYVDFYGYHINVDNRALIPRFETEMLVDETIKLIKEKITNPKIIDVGTGSGCIAISLAHELKLADKLKQVSWQVVAVDLSTEALKVAQHNAVSNAVDIEFVHSSWYEALSTQDEQLFDVIVSNPPYIDEADEHLAGLLAEPISALSAPNHGLADIEHITKYAPQYLQEGGLLAIEHGFDQGRAVHQLFIDNHFIKVKTIQDFGGNDRVTLGQFNKYAL